MRPAWDPRAQSVERNGPPGAGNGGLGETAGVRGVRGRRGLHGDRRSPAAGPFHAERDWPQRYRKYRGVPLPRFI